MRFFVCFVKIWVLLLATLSATAIWATDAGSSTPKKQKFVVDMADGLNFDEFHNDKNAEAIYSSELSAPWKKRSVVNAYENDGSKKQTRTTQGINGLQKASVAEEKNSATSAETNANKSAAIENEQLINTRAPFSPEDTPAALSATQLALYHQMSTFCMHKSQRLGFQKVAEWLEPNTENGYYIYYQFQCIFKK